MTADTYTIDATGRTVCPYCGAGDAFACCAASVGVAEARAEAAQLRHEMARLQAMPPVGDVALALRASFKLAEALKGSPDLRLRCQAEHATACIRYVRAAYDEAARVAGVELPDYERTIARIVAARQGGA